MILLNMIPVNFYSSIQGLMIYEKLQIHEKNIKKIWPFQGPNMDSPAGISYEPTP